MPEGVEQPVPSRARDRVSASKQVLFFSQFIILPPIIKKRYSAAGGERREASLAILYPINPEHSQYGIRNKNKVKPLAINYKRAGIPTITQQYGEHSNGMHPVLLR